MQIDIQGEIYNYSEAEFKRVLAFILKDMGGFDVDKLKNLISGSVANEHSGTASALCTLIINLYHDNLSLVRRSMSRTRPIDYAGAALAILRQLYFAAEEDNEDGIKIIEAMLREQHV